MKNHEQNCNKSIEMKSMKSFKNLLILHQKTFVLSKFICFKVGKELLDYGRKIYSKESLNNLKNSHPEIGKILLKDLGFETGKQILHVQGKLVREERC
jgi:hypothetical protein